jgi:hypothetical protein
MRRNKKCFRLTQISSKALIPPFALSLALLKRTLRLSSTMKLSLGIFSSAFLLLLSNAKAFSFLSSSTFFKLDGLMQLFGSTPPSSTVPVEFGDSVELSADGKRMLVGAPSDNGGNVYLYERDDSTAVLGGTVAQSQWRLVWELPGTANEKNLGDRISMSADGQTIAIRRYNAPHRRDIEVYKIGMNSTHESTMVGNPILACPGSSGKFVKLMDASPSSAPNSDLWLLGSCETYDSNRGKVAVFYFDAPSDTWVEVSSLQGYSRQSLFGWSTGFMPSQDDGTIRLAVSSPNSNSRRGLVQAFEVDMNGWWYQIGGDLQGEEEGDQFGFSMDIATAAGVSSLVVGAPQCDGSFLGKSRGCIYVYKWKQDFMDWSQVGTRAHTGLDGNKDRFGRRVAFSKDGSRVAASSIYHNRQSGYVRIYEVESDRVTKVTDIVSEDKLSRLGSSLAMNDEGSMIVAGSTGSRNEDGQSVGSVQVFVDDTFILPSTVLPAGYDPNEASSKDAPSNSNLRGYDGTDGVNLEELAVEHKEYLVCGSAGAFLFLGGFAYLRRRGLKCQKTEDESEPA